MIELDADQVGFAPADDVIAALQSLTLSGFLLARIEEDEQAAAMFRPEHGCRWQSRVPAECEAKRRIIDAYRSAEADADYWPHRAPESHAAAQAVARLSAWTFALTSLALPYADHPDFREEWRP